MTTERLRHHRAVSAPLSWLALLFLAALSLAQPAGAQEAAAAKRDKAPAGVAGQLEVIDAKLDRIAVALEAQQEMAQLELMLRRVESAERRIDGLETARLQARTYLSGLNEKRVVAERLLAKALETVKTGWPPGPRSEALQARDDAQTNLTELTNEIEGIQASLAEIDARVAKLRNDAVAWSVMLESRLAELAANPVPAALGGSPAAAAGSSAP